MAHNTGHLWDSVVEDLTSWLTEGPVTIADDIRSGGRAPFAAQTSDSDKLNYYKGTFNNPDGTPNDQARAETLERVGIGGFAKIMHALGEDKAAETRPNLEVI